MEYQEGLDELDGKAWNLMVLPETTIAEDFMHELKNHEAKLSAYKELASAGGATDLIEGFEELEATKENVESFQEDLAELKSFLNRRGYLTQEKIDRLQDYHGDFDGKIGHEVDCVADLSRDIFEYQKRSSGNSTDNPITVEGLLKPAQRAVDIEEFEGEFIYNGLEDEYIAPDHGVSLIVRTLTKNMWDHGPSLGADELYAEVKEQEDAYEIDYWDNGEGLFGEFEEREEREEKAESFFSGEGNGLPMSRKVAETYGGWTEYSEEMLEEEEGFGVRITLPKYQNSTSEPL